MDADWVFWVTAAAAGLVVGSFINLVVWRGAALWGLEDGVDRRARGDFIAPRSYCPSCGATLAWRDLVPVLSYVLARGKCRRCAAAISPRYPIVELAAASAALLALGVFGPTTDALFAACALFLLLAIAEIDRRTGWIPDVLSQPLIWLGLVANLGGRFAPLPDAVIGAAAGYLAFAAVAAGYRIVRGKEGLGDGDAVLLAGVGAWTGWAALPSVVLAAAALGLVFALVLLLRRGRSVLSEATPFGPALAAAGAAALLLSRTPGLPF